MPTTTPDALAVRRVATLTDQAADAFTEWRNCQERRDNAIREACDQGWTPRTLHRAGVRLSESNLYRVIGTVE